MPYKGKIQGKNARAAATDLGANCGTTFLYMDRDAGRSTYSADEQPQYSSGSSKHNDMYPRRSAALHLLDKARSAADKEYSSHIVSEVSRKGAPIHNVEAGTLHRATTALPAQGKSISTDKTFLP